MRVFDPKRLIDAGASAAALVLLSPLLLLIASAVCIFIGRPVLFRQVRPGLHGRPFKLIKFRTMLNASDEGGRPLSDAARMTAFGRLLRSTSLDELPELWNVLKGEMSLVGPRPLLMEYLDRYSPEQARRHDVRPGLTGWAQVNGRNSLSWEDKFALDLWYVENRTVLLDIRILFMTFVQVFRRSGISSEGHETAAEFMGSNSDGRPGSPGGEIVGAEDKAQ
jgi:sugar transferase EpsL